MSGTKAVFFVGDLCLNRRASFLTDSIGSLSIYFLPVESFLKTPISSRRRLYILLRIMFGLVSISLF